MEAFVITLREGIEAALIIGLILAYLNRRGQTEMKNWVYAGLALALGASVVGGLGFRAVGIDPENEMVEGILMAMASVLVLSLVVWMWRASRSIKRDIEGRLAKITSDGPNRGWPLLAFVFFMVFREGVETVLFLTALSLTSSADLVGVIGGIAGLALATLFGIAFIKGGVRINLRRFFAITGFVLVVLALRLAAGSIHEFIEVGAISVAHWFEEIVEFISEDSTSLAILIALVVLPLLSMWPAWRPGPRSIEAQTPN